MNCILDQNSNLEQGFKRTENAQFEKYESSGSNKSNVNIKMSEENSEIEYLEQLLDENSFEFENEKKQLLEKIKTLEASLLERSNYIKQVNSKFELARDRVSELLNELTVKENEIKKFRREMKNLSDKPSVAKKIMNKAEIMYLRDQNKELVNKYSKSLKPPINENKQRRILEMHEQGLSMNEIARLLRVSKSTVHKHVHKKIIGG